MKLVPPPIALLSACFGLLIPSVAFAADGPKDADNTARNERDKNSQSPTPIDQGNNKADLAATKKIRQAIVANKSLSTNAHNVKVITMGGHVTLRGPVDSPEEKATVGDIAVSVASAENVSNELEVKANPSK